MSTDIPSIEIAEQPARNAVRFRYESDPRFPTAITGESSTSINISYPSLRVVNYVKKRVKIVISCVTIDKPYKQHPNYLVGSGCINKKGIYSTIFSTENEMITLKGIGVQCSKRDQIEERLTLRRKIKIDPTNQKFGHISNFNINLNAIRLCFQAYFRHPITGRLTVPSEPIISEPIYNKRVYPTLMIKAISQTCFPTTGGKLMLICDRIDDQDIELIVYRKGLFGEMIKDRTFDKNSPSFRIHRKVGIVVELLPIQVDIDDFLKTEIFIELYRASDNCRSNLVKLTYWKNCHQNCPLKRNSIELNNYTNTQEELVFEPEIFNSIQKILDANTLTIV